MRTTRTSTSSSWMEHEHLVVVDGVDDAACASPSRPIPLELEPQGLPDPVWVLGKWVVEEVDHRHGHRFGTAGPSLVVSEGRLVTYTPSRPSFLIDGCCGV